jgi:hypothetical protein
MDANLEEKRRELIYAYVNEQFEHGHEISKVVELMEGHAASHGGREHKKTR